MVGDSAMAEYKELDVHNTCTVQVTFPAEVSYYAILYKAIGYNINSDGSQVLLAYRIHLMHLM